MSRDNLEGMDYLRFRCLEGLSEPLPRALAKLQYGPFAVLRIANEDPAVTVSCGFNAVPALRA